MNSSNGGPHILLFERDQQMSTLLMSDFQLAGYECHAARTAVEVFDAIARFPIRLVLVNLAQAAAARREFWVALDTQRRGKGVQVLTFHAMNIAGYGPVDAEDRSQMILADMEVDGLRGVRSLIETVRARIPGSTTGAMSRLMQTGTGEGKLHPTYPLTGQTTAPLPPVPPGNVVATTSPAVETESAQRAGAFPGYPMANRRDVPMQPPGPPNSISAQPGATLPPGNPPAPLLPAKPPEPTRANTPIASFTDKIRAVIYPNARSSSPPPPQAPQFVPTQPTSRTGYEVRQPNIAVTGPQAMNGPAIQAPAPADTPGQTVQPVSPPVVQANTLAPPVQPQQGLSEPGLEQLSRMVQERQQTGAEERPEAVAQQATRPISLSDLSLRASPIQDLPVEQERHVEARSQEDRAEHLSPAYDAQQPSGSSPPTKGTTKVTGPLPAIHTESTTDQEEEKRKEVRSQDNRDEGGEQVQIIQQGSPQRSTEYSSAGSPEGAIGTDNVFLLDIVQSLPPMPTPPQTPQPLILSGRATRSLGSVLLEGHLVPKHRLEVALHIQRMLRGVDMSYQLGEILLMFKLLTHDQLLAASLVSYGLITTAQLSALGRIRQELHSIGLEYDLESLLMLFRILTPEQLREVRSSWSG